MAICTKLTGKYSVEVIVVMTVMLGHFGLTYGYFYVNNAAERAWGSDHEVNILLDYYKKNSGA